MGKKFLVLCIILLIHFQQIGFFFPLADTDSTPRPLGHKDIGYLPYQGIGSSVFIDTGICAVFLEICLHILCFGVIKLIKMGNISCVPGKDLWGAY